MAQWMKETGNAKSSCLELCEHEHICSIHKHCEPLLSIHYTLNAFFHAYSKFMDTILFNSLVAKKIQCMEIYVCYLYVCIWDLTCSF